jgi:hypothetical protein
LDIIRSILPEKQSPKGLARLWGQRCIQFFLSLLRFGEHALKQVVFEGHGVRTTLVRQEKLAVAGKNAPGKRDVMVIIVTVEGDIKLIKVESFPILGIAFGFFDLSDQSVVHFYSPLWIEMKKARRKSVPFKSRAGRCPLTHA